MNAATIGALILAPMHLALAQDAGSLLREQQRQQEQQRLEQLPQAEEQREQENPSVAPETGETIIVREVRFTGKLDLLPEDERVRLAASVTGKRVGINGIRTLADDITAALQQRGHLLASAILPPQDITEGLVTFEIVAGRLEATTFERSGSTRVREDRLRKIAESHIAAGSVAKEDLEEALLRMNDHPGVSARARLTPGNAPNTSNLVVNVAQARVFSASVQADNFGSYSTGKEQMNVAAILADLSGNGDLTQLAVVASEGQTFTSGSFNVPLGASRFTGRADYGYLDYHNIDDTGSALGLEGRAQFAGFGLDYSLVRSRDFNMRLSGSVNGKALVDDSIFGRLQDKRSLTGTLGLSGDAQDFLLGGGLTYWSASWTYGDLDLSREASALAADKASLQTNGAFQRVDISLTRLQKLPGSFSLFGRMSGQWANKNLDSSEDFTLGGPYGMRGWPVGEGRGDMGVLGTVELRYDTPTLALWGEVQLAVFIDAGHIRVNKNPDGIAPPIACGCNDYGLADAGLSIRWSHEYFTLSASYAEGLGSNPGRSANTGTNADNTNNNQQFWLTGMARF